MVRTGLFQWLLRSRTALRKTARRSSRRCTAPSCLLAVERLEDRAVPSVSVLNNGGHGYAGLSFNQSGGYVPPDSCGAAGPSAYVETVNQSLAIYSPKSTGASAVLDSFSHFLFITGKLTRADSGSSIGDPGVVYDELIGRFIVGDLDVDFNTYVSAFDLAVSKTNNPTTLSASDWNFYKIVTTEPGYWLPDYPGNFGYNHDALVITLNMFDAFGDFRVQVVAVNATDLVNGAASPGVFKNDLNDLSVRPTTMHGSVAGDPMWLVTEHHTPYGYADNQSIDVIKMTGELTTSPTFTYTNLPVMPYSHLVVPRNPDGTGITNNMDSRILKAAEANNTIVATHDVGVSLIQDAAQWYAINVSSGTPTLSQQGLISAGDNTYITYPGIDINSSGQIGMSYMKSGTDTTTDFLSMWVTGRAATDTAGTMQYPPAIVPAGTGLANYKDFTTGGRAGDLSGINVDPVDGTFWAANEFANTQATANWGTAIANFAPSPSTASTDLAVTASGPSSVTATTNATYTITLANNGPNPAQGVILSDLLPTGATFVSMTPAANNPDTFTPTRSGNTVIESAATVGTGNTDIFTLVVYAPTSLSNGANFSDTASVISSTPDTNTANDSATVTGSIINNHMNADLAVSINWSATANEGDDIGALIIVNNYGPNDATGAVLTYTLDPNERFISATTVQGTISQSGNVVIFNFGTLLAGYMYIENISFQAIEDGTLTNSASVTSGIPDLNPANNSETVRTAVAEPPIVVSPLITTKLPSLSNFTVATFTHANGVEPVSAFKATINWGDGKTSTGAISQSGTTYSVLSSHNYLKSGSHKISTTVIEIGNSPQLLLAKMGDEVPGLPDLVGTFQDDGRFFSSAPINNIAEIIGALVGPSPSNQPTFLVGVDNGTSGGVTAQNLAASVEAMLASSATEPRELNSTALLGSHSLQRQADLSLLDVPFLIDDFSLADLFKIPHSAAEL